MNFEELKKEMDASADNNPAKLSIDLEKGKNNPVYKIKRNMRMEIIAQLVFVVIFMTYPKFKKLEALPEALYYIFMFITCLMTLSYTIKLSSFLRKTSNFAMNSRDTIKEFIFESKLTLEVFKSFVIAGSLIAPIPIFIMINGRSERGNMEIFTKYFNLDLSATELILLIAGYVLIAILIYLVTIFYTQRLYGKYVSELEVISKQFDS